MTTAEIRKQHIIEKYGSWEAYEQKRALATRERALSRCSTEEERIAKLAKLAKRDAWRASVIPENIGKEIACSRCGATFIAGKNQHLYCRKCVLEVARIERSGTLEDYFRESTEKNKETKKSRYGSSTYNNRDKAKATCLDRYGYPHQNQNEIQKDKIAKTKLERYGDPAFNNRQKTVETLKKKYGENIVSTAQLEETKVKARITKLARYKNATFNNREQAIKTCHERFGGNTPACDPNILQKMQNTMVERFGVVHPSQSEECRTRAKDVLKEKYGVENVMQDEGIKLKSCSTRLERYGSFNVRSLYYYDSNYFDSSWELRYYIYLKDHNIVFEYKPKPIQYRDSTNSLHRYFPDFKVGDTYIEIKGDHLLSPEGILRDTHKRLQIDKTEALRILGVRILTGKDLIKEFEYVGTSYPKDFIKSLRVPLTHKKDNNHD
jgi:hypothetical protein